MPNVDMMDKDCCKTIIADIKNLINPHVTIQFIWKSCKPLQLIDIARLFNRYSSQISTVCVKTQIDEDVANCIKLYCSQLTKYKMRSSRFGVQIKVVESSITIVYEFIHGIKKQGGMHHLFCVIPKGIYDVCCMFYDCFLQIPVQEASPFVILFAIFDVQPVLSIVGWTLLNHNQQCKYLKDENINSLAKRQKLMLHLTEYIYDFSDITLLSKSTIQNNILLMLSKYQSNIELKPIETGSGSGSGSTLLVSLIHYLVNTSSDHLRQSQTTWQFVEYFRRYCRDMQYNGASFYKDSKLKNG
eukprot:384202_1